MATGHQRPRVVVVGGGPAGLEACQALSSDAEVTLIEPKGFHEINWASLRAMVEPPFLDKVLTPYSNIPNIGSVIMAHAKSFNETSVVTDTGVSVPYDYLVLAPGSSYPSPDIKAVFGSLAERQQTYKEGFERLKAANSVLIIGGGPVGVELAGEIVEEMPGKQVTVVTSAERLIADKRSRVGSISLAHLTKKGVKVITRHRAEQHPDGHSYMAGGNRIIADITYLTVGATPNTKFLGPSFPLDDKGFVKVEATLQVEGCPKVYGVGDCNNVAETKIGVLASAQAAVAAANIKAQIHAAAQGKDGTALKPYKVNKGGPEAMIVSLGRKNAVMQFGPLVFGGFVPTWLKCGDMFANKTRGHLGIKG